MPYGFDTPNLALLARPYRESIDDVISSAYGFKDNVRSDFLKDQFVPAKMLEAQNAYEQQHFDLTNRANVAPYDLQRNLYDAQIGASGARDDFSMYPTMRGIYDQTNVYSGIGNMYDAQTQLDERRNAILDQEAKVEYAKMFESTSGNDPLDRSMTVYNKTLDSGNPALANYAQSQLVDNARRILDSSIPGSPVYTKAANVLRRFGQYGTVSVPSAVGSQTGWSP